MQKIIQPTKKLIGESFFKCLPKDGILLESDFVRLDKSIIWKMSELFWKYYEHWEKIYGEDFESSLPSGISESHREEFIANSAKRFVDLLEELDKNDQLPKTIYIYEQGPGAGIFAKGFLDILQKKHKKFYEKVIYILTDTSTEILTMCKNVLDHHHQHTLYFQQSEFEKDNNFTGKILFARHSNVWDGWPCRNIQVRQSGLGEMYVRAVCNKKFESFVADINVYGLEKALLKNKLEWKDFFRHIKLQTRTIPLGKIDIKQKPYFHYLQTNAHKHPGTNTLLSDAMTDNLSFLNSIIDEKRGGYIEIVDIISEKPRKIIPKKFDGSIAYIIDGTIVRHWCHDNNKDVTFTQIRKLNTMITIKKKKKTDQLTQMIKDASYEIFPTDKVVEDVGHFKKNTHLAVTCTSKKGIDYTIDITSELRKKGYNAYPHIIARKITDEDDLKKIKSKLKENKIEEIFVAAGDIDKATGQFTSAMELLKSVEKIGISFKKLAITGYPEGDPKISNEKLLEALQEKQEFVTKNKLDGRIISQLCFDADTIVTWALGLKEKGIDLPIVIGIAGPCNIFQLVQFAIKCGVGESVKFLTSKKTLGKNITANISLHYQPERIIQEILSHPLFEKTTIIGFHFYTFNNIKGLVSWQKAIEEKNNL